MKITRDITKLRTFGSMEPGETFRFLDSADVCIKGQYMSGDSSSNSNKCAYFFNLVTLDYDWMYADLKIIPTTTELTVYPESKEVMQ